MWQSPNPWHTQRTSLRRMGLFTCLMTVLLLGFLIGRGSRDEATPDQIYLNNTGPAKPTATPGAEYGGADRRAPLGRVLRPTASPVAPREQPSPHASRSPRTSIEGYQGDDESRPIIGGGQRENAAPSYPLSALENEVVRLVNIERRRSGCAPFRIDRRLTRSAREHSAEMAEEGVFSHSSPDGASPWERMEAAGYRDGGAENIGRGYTSATEAVRNWMTTGSNRSNLLNCRLTTTGVGVVDGPGGPWWTQDFGYS